MRFTLYALTSLFEPTLFLISSASSGEIISSKSKKTTQSCEACCIAKFFCDEKLTKSLVMSLTPSCIASSAVLSVLLASTITISSANDRLSI